MSAIVERYDANASDYARYWAPVLEASSRRLLGEIAGFLERAAVPLRLLDIGSGTGVLALAAAARWPAVQVIASDPAAGMLDLARSQARAEGLLGEAERSEANRRLSFVVGPADRLPLPDRSVDIALSSFVLQLVPDRSAALREAHRLLRPGGLLAYVTWLDREARQPFRPMEEFDEAVFELDVDEPDEAGEACAGDVVSGRAAAEQLRRAGFRNVTAREDLLTYDWTLEDYLRYKLAYDERALLSMLSVEQAKWLERRARERLERLAPADFRWHAPIVFARGVRPG